MTTRDDVPPGARGAAPATPAGDHDDDGHAAQRDQRRRVQASYKRGNRGGQWRRRAARGTLPDRAGMIRRPPPEPPDAA